jgi:hypothetical protein
MTAKAAGKQVRAAAVNKRKSENVEEITPEEPPQKPKTKKAKVKVRDEIDAAVEELEEKETRNRGRKKYGRMTKSTSTNRTREKSSRRPASEAPSELQVQVTSRPWKTRREGATANTAQEDAFTNSDQLKDDDDQMGGHNRYSQTHAYMCLLLT